MKGSNMFRRLLTFGLMLVLVVSLTGCSKKTDGEDLTAGKDATQILEEATQKLNETQSYDMTMTMVMTGDMDGENFGMNVDAKAKAFQNPIKMEMVMDMKIDMMGTTEETTMTQYIVPEGDQYVMYQGTEGQWQKIVVDDAEIAASLAMDPTSSTEALMEDLVSAEIAGDEDLNGKKTVKIDVVVAGSAFGDIMGDYGDMLGGLDAGALSDMSDIKYTIWVEKSTLNIVKYDMDLTEPMRSIYSSLFGPLTEGADDETKQMIETFLGSLTMTMVMTIDNIDAATDFEVPAEALDAEEISMSDLLG